MKILAVVLFLAVWVFACFLQDSTFKIEVDAYLMAYGYLTGVICTEIMSAVKNA